MTQRMHIVVRGAVQGVGFRPFVYRLAGEHSLAGWVLNNGEGVFIEAEGGAGELRSFLLRLESERPPRASIQSLEYAILDPAGYGTFEIRPSPEGGPLTAFILPDAATCSDCLEETFDPGNRRYLYPFTNCTNCGPRFTIVTSLPYDRPNTTMRTFAMCPSCRGEYDNPLDRRFHAQPNACPACGPRLALWDGSGAVLAERHDALLAAAAAIRAGKIVAVKGLGGFQLMADARDDNAVRRLRERKRREEKPLAVMFPSGTTAGEECLVSDLERRALVSPESPIVLLKRRQGAGSPAAGSVAPSVAPGNPYLGVMLPYTPLHHILLRELGFPVVATSGNLSDEPICIDEREALRRLSGIADLFLVHDRPIRRHADDSIVRVVMDRECVLRRARGYAPLPVGYRAGDAAPILAVGAHLKNAVALGIGGQAFVSQHVGDLETAEAYDAFRGVIADFTNIYLAPPALVACDLHPDYLSTKHAKGLGTPLRGVQHHYAHVLSCMADNRIEGEVLGVSWDGTGYGTDGTVWGGEFLLTTLDGFDRVAALRSFRLPGGDAAVREPRRAAFGLLYEIFGERLSAGAGGGPVVRGADLRGIATLDAIPEREMETFAAMLVRGFNSPLTSSAGRLFDAVASILGIRQVSKHEGQAAMELEFAGSGWEEGRGAPRHAPSIAGDERYRVPIREPVDGSGLLTLDWAPMILAILGDRQAGTPASTISMKFHDALAAAIAAVAARIGVERVALTGGCFQNVLLLTRTVDSLKAAGFRPYWHQRVPPNDGGIALGQICAAARRPAGAPSDPTAAGSAEAVPEPAHHHR